MLALKPFCENCGKALPANSTEARICSFECTFCSTCVDTILLNVCPNCGGGLEIRPIRPTEKLLKYPATTESNIKPLNPVTFQILRDKNKDIQPQNR